MMAEPEDPMGADWKDYVDAIPERPRVVPIRPETTPPSQVDAPKLVPIPDHQLMGMDIPRPATILDPWLLEKGLVMIHGYRGLGKSWLALSIAVAVARGGRFLGFESAGGHKVVYVDGEMPAYALQERLWLISGAVQSGDVGQLDIIAADLQRDGVPSLAGQVGQAALEPHLDGAALVVVDNLATLAGSDLDSNSAESWRPMQEWLLSQRRKGRAVLIVHHSGKGGQQRGTSAREDILDAVIGLHRLEDGDASEGLRAKMSFEKARSARGDAIGTAEIVLLEQEDGSVEWVRHNPPPPPGKRDPRSEDARIMRSQGESLRTIAATIGVSKSTVERWLK